MTDEIIRLIFAMLCWGWIWWTNHRIWTLENKVEELEGERKAEHRGWRRTAERLDHTR